MYNRNYIQNDNSSSNDFTQQSGAEEFTGASRTKNETLTFLKATYQLFAGSLMGAAAGAYVGLGILPYIMGAMFWVLVIMEFGLIFAIRATAKKPGINLIVLFSFTFISGMTLAPLLASFLHTTAGASIVANAFVLTSVAFGGISMFALTTKKDYTGMSKMLFVTLIVVVVASIINIFTHSPMLHLAISGVSAILFSAFILHDTQHIVKGNIETPIEACLMLYLDFLNLFVSLLHILGVMNNDD
jgi:modulator of FtsH protease